MVTSKKEGEYDGLAPKYCGERWISVQLPRHARDWSDGGDKSITTPGQTRKELVHALGELKKNKSWHWPNRRQFFFSDLHGDAEAFSASLVATGGVERHGKLPTDFSINSIGREANFIIGGDCFDKGPSSLELLRTVRQLKKRGARVRILAGNHDIRLLFGMRSVGKQKETRNEHFFIRTGRKVIPLLREVWQDHVQDDGGLRNIPSEKECRQLLYPRKSWFDEFPQLKHDEMSPAQIKRELQKIAQKTEKFEQLCDDAGLNLRQVYAATQQWKSMFLEKGGEFRWFYKNMRLCYRAGSCLFIHAGVDDSIAKSLAKHGVHNLNRQFRKAMYDAPLDYYYSAICNTIRTKYREVDLPFTEKGPGTSAVPVSRHWCMAIGTCTMASDWPCAAPRSISSVDTSLDRHTRQLENVTGRGASVTIVEPGGFVLGISSDFPHIKAFHPEITLGNLEANRA